MQRYCISCLSMPFGRLFIALRQSVVSLKDQPLSYCAVASLLVLAPHDPVRCIHHDHITSLSCTFQNEALLPPQPAIQRSPHSSGAELSSKGRPTRMACLHHTEYYQTRRVDSLQTFSGPGGRWIRHKKEQQLRHTIPMKHLGARSKNES